MPTQAEITALNKKQLSAADFQDDARVKAAVAAVQAQKPVVSDILDKEGHQYVNLVQKGGGVLGIALVGYTYVLEQAGIRFLKMAGTSAGAINTSLMVLPPDKSKAKSDFLIKALSELDLFKLVDGHPIARLLIKRFVKKADFGARVQKISLLAIIILVLLVVLCFICLGFKEQSPFLAAITWEACIATAIYISILTAIGIYIASLLKKLKNSGFGINPGDFFYDWVKGHMSANGINTVADLEQRAAEKPDLLMRAGRNESTADLVGSVTFIASELVTENKFELPKMARYFRLPQDIDKLHPAGFVRASMAIPVFFESFYITDIPCTDPGIKKLWKDTFDVDDPPSTVRFVDGGILSNFPINLFYNKDIEVPRIPTFGIDLDDSKPEDKRNHAEDWSFGGYIGRMFNTVRFYYDKDFLLKNNIMNKGIGKVPVADFNWLNFFLTNQQKVDLFAIGAEAAADFLSKFDWPAYKGERKEFYAAQQTKQ